MSLSSFLSRLSHTWADLFSVVGSFWADVFPTDRKRCEPPCLDKLFRGIFDELRSPGKCPCAPRHANRFEDRASGPIKIKLPLSRHREHRPRVLAQHSNAIEAVVPLQPALPTVETPLKKKKTVRFIDGHTTTVFPRWHRGKKWKYVEFDSDNCYELSVPRWIKPHGRTQSHFPQTHWPTKDTRPVEWDDQIALPGIRPSVSGRALALQPTDDSSAKIDDDWTALPELPVDDSVVALIDDDGDVVMGDC
ncbi:MAG: hypothetical protein M4579_002931 [Chaenotheca gracillima]|nr:MAG: hypothetical protein M4579_002931 [Chaenotheca gracillima]